MESVVERCLLFGDVLCIEVSVNGISTIVPQYLSYIVEAMVVGGGVVTPMLLLRTNPFPLP